MAVYYYGLLKEVKAWAPDVIHTNSSICDIGARLAIDLSVPHVWHVRETLEHYTMKYLLYITIRMGYKEIGFVGGEYSFWKDCYIDDRDGRIELVVPHCYGINNVICLDSYDEYSRNKSGIIAAFLRRTADSFDCFYNISEYAKWKGTTIINYSKGTMLEFFENRDFSE